MELTEDNKIIISQPEFELGYNYPTLPQNAVFIFYNQGLNYQQAGEVVANISQYFNLTDARYENEIPSSSEQLSLKDFYEKLKDKSVEDLEDNVFKNKSKTNSFGVSKVEGCMKFIDFLVKNRFNFLQDVNNKKIRDAIQLSIEGMKLEDTFEHLKTLTSDVNEPYLDNLTLKALERISSTVVPEHTYYYDFLKQIAEENNLTPKEVVLYIRDQQRELEKRSRIKNTEIPKITYTIVNELNNIEYSVNFHENGDMELQAIAGFSFKGDKKSNIRVNQYKQLKKVIVENGVDMCLPMYGKSDETTPERVLEFDVNDTTKTIRFYQTNGPSFFPPLFKKMEEFVQKASWK
jgi:hypothetical protein